MPPDVMRERGSVVNSAAQMLSSGDVNLDTMPKLILRIIDEGMWRQRAIPQQRWELSRRFDSFEEFVTGKPLDGLGTTVRMLLDLCRRDIHAQVAIDRATEHERGGDHTNGNNIPIAPRPEGTSQAKALRRLRQKRPDLLERVVAGELSAHAAAIEAGFRHRTITVRADDPQHAARILRRHYMDPEQLRLLVKHLQETERWI